VPLTLVRALRPASLATAVLSLGLLTACSDGAEEQDATELETFEGEGFSIDLPGEPTMDTQTVQSPAGELELTTYSVDFGEAAVAIAVTDVPEGAPVDLDGSVDGAASNINGTVRESETGEFDGLETRDAVIDAEVEGQEGTAFARIIDAEGRLVQVLQIVEGTVEEPPENYDEIVDSLQLS